MHNIEQHIGGGGMQLSMTTGIVKATNDPNQMGCIQIHCDTLDGDDYTVENLPWAHPEMILGGSVANMSCGAPDPSSGEPKVAKGLKAYGFWGVPKVGAQVIVRFMAGDTSFRIYGGALMPLHTNRSLPAGRNLDDGGAKGPWTDEYEPMEPYYTNMRQAGLEEDGFWETRGGYERQVAQAKTDKDGSEGYAEDPSRKDGTLDPQTYSWTSPGGHFISMQDSPEFCRIRLRTTHGHQIIMDDTNERIYISTAKGASYIELDQDGHIHIHAEESISINTEKDFCVNAEGFINMNAEKGFNFKSPKSMVTHLGESSHLNVGKDALITAGSDFNLNAGGSVFATASSAMHLNGGGKIIQTGGKIHLNGPSASKAGKADTNEKQTKEFIPRHEPWKDRPDVNTDTNHGPRNKHHRK